jgi:hypothetical protein
MRSLRLKLAAFLAVSSLSAVSYGQGVMNEVYGRGVHAYNAGDTDKAIEWLDMAINAGSEDPRVYYYHGLAMMRQSGGTIDAGISDFEQAANLEITNGRIVDVGRALERIQGDVRRQIEDIRLRVRLENKDRLPRVPVAPSAPANLDATTDPFADDQGMASGQPEEMAPVPATEEPATGADPFDAAPTTPEPAAEGSPFGDSSAPATDNSNPFGESSESSTENPFQ